MTKHWHNGLACLVVNELTAVCLSKTKMLLFLALHQAYNYGKLCHKLVFTINNTSCWVAIYVYAPAGRYRASG